MRTDFGPREAARLAAVLYIASAALSAVVLLLPQAPGIDRAAILVVAAVATVLGGLTYVMPWDRWPKRTTVVLLPIAFALIAVGNWFGSARDPSYSVFFVVAFVWLGITQPRWTSLPFAPIAGIAYVAPILLRNDDATADAATAGLAIPVCVLVAEILGWVVAREQRSRQIAQSLARLAAKVAHRLDEDTLCQTLVDESKSALSAEHAIFYKVDPATGALSALYTSDVNERTAQALRRMLGSRIDDMPAELRRGETIVVEDVPRAPSRTDIDTARRFHVKSYIAMPVMAQDTVVGVLSCWETSRRRTYQDDELALAAGFAGHASAAFQNAMLYEQTLAASRNDALTGLGNRRAFREQLGSEVERARRHGRELSLIVLDADRFKSINDTLGHQAGDHALVQIAAILERNRRMEDGTFRIGGDEFAVLLPETDTQGAIVLAERLRRLVEQEALGNGRTTPLTVSIGLSTLVDHASHVDELFERADTAMYDAKAAGGNAIALPGEPSSPGAEWLGVDIDAIIEGEHVRAVYQPIFDLRSGEVMGFEALCRLDPAIGHAPITTLLRAAGAASRLVAFDRLCRQTAVRGAKDLPFGALLFLNIAPAVLEADRFDACEIVELVDSARLSVDRVVIELTEHERTLRSSRSLSNLAACKDAGFAIALDGFGAGGSDLDLLAGTTFDFVKVSMSYVHRATATQTRRRMLRGLAVLATESGAQTIAQGLETLEDLQLVTELGFGAAQGFLLREPASTLDPSPRLPRTLGARGAVHPA